MEKAQTLVGVAHTYIHVYSLLNKIEKNYIENVVISLSLKLDNIVNKDSNYVQDNCA